MSHQIDGITNPNAEFGLNFQLNNGRKLTCLFLNLYDKSKFRL